MSVPTDVEILTGERAEHVARMASRAFEKAGFGDPAVGYLSQMLYVAEREFNVNFSISSGDGAVDHRIFVLAHTWGCMVHKRVSVLHTKFVGRRRMSEMIKTDVVLGVQFKGDWTQYTSDAVLIAMAPKNNA